MTFRIFTFECPVCSERFDELVENFERKWPCKCGETAVRVPNTFGVLTRDTGKISEQLKKRAADHNEKAKQKISGFEPSQHKDPPRFRRGKGRNPSMLRPGHSKTS